MKTISLQKFAKLTTSLNWMHTAKTIVNKSCTVITVTSKAFLNSGHEMVMTVTETIYPNDLNDGTLSYFDVNSNILIVADYMEDDFRIADFDDIKTILTGAFIPA